MGAGKSEMASYIAQDCLSDKMPVVMIVRGRELVKNLSNSDANQRMIVEINRFTRITNKTLTYDYIKSLKGKKVQIQGSKN